MDSLKASLSEWGQFAILNLEKKTKLNVDDWETYLMRGEMAFPVILLAKDLP